MQVEEFLVCSMVGFCWVVVVSWVSLVAFVVVIVFQYLKGGMSAEVVRKFISFDCI